MKKSKVYIQPYESPCGTLLLGEHDGRLCLCDWADEARRRKTEVRLRRALNATYEERPTPLLRKAAGQLDEYFGGKRTRFDVPLLPVGTAFQQAAWQELLHIPYGKTLSYAGLACRLGCPKAVRAVASAMGANTLSILLPCHRVIGSNHRLTGYAGGIPAKRHLLTLEMQKEINLSEI